jgi:hypothetical protein
LKAIENSSWQPNFSIIAQNNLNNNKKIWALILKKFNHQINGNY